MLGRVFTDEPEEEYQARLEAVRVHMREKGHDEAHIAKWAETILECQDEFDAEIIRDILAAQKALEPSL